MRRPWRFTPATGRIFDEAVRIALAGSGAAQRHADEVRAVALPCDTLARRAGDEAAEAALLEALEVLAVELRALRDPGIPSRPRGGTAA